MYKSWKKKSLEVVPRNVISKPKYDRNVTRNEKRTIPKSKAQKLNEAANPG